MCVTVRPKTLYWSLVLKTKTKTECNVCTHKIAEMYSVTYQKQANGDKIRQHLCVTNNFEPFAVHQVTCRGLVKRATANILLGFGVLSGQVGFGSGNLDLKLTCNEIFKQPSIFFEAFVHSTKIKSGSLIVTMNYFCSLILKNIYLRNPVYNIT